MSIKILKFDIKNGIIKRAWLYAVVFLFFLLADFILFMQRMNMGIDNPEILMQRFTIGDMLLYATGGAKRFVIEDGTAFSYPILWMLLILIISFINLRYPVDNLCGFGRHIMILSGDRSAWWISKCVWMMFSVCIYYFSMLLSAASFALIVGADYSLNISEFLPSMFMLNLRELTPMPWDIVVPLLLHIFTVYVLCLLQMLLSFYIRPLMSFFIISAILLFSVFFSSPMLIGNLAMPLRTENITTDEPISLGLGFIICFSLCAAIFLIGLIKINSVDILTKED